LPLVFFQPATMCSPFMYILPCYDFTHILFILVLTPIGISNSQLILCPWPIYKNLPLYDILILEYLLWFPCSLTTQPHLDPCEASVLDFQKSLVTPRDLALYLTSMLQFQIYFWTPRPLLTLLESSESQKHLKHSDMSMRVVSAEHKLTPMSEPLSAPGWVVQCTEQHLNTGPHVQAPWSPMPLTRNFFGHLIPTCLHGLGSQRISPFSDSNSYWNSKAKLLLCHWIKNRSITYSFLRIEGIEY